MTYDDVNHLSAKIKPKQQKVNKRMYLHRLNAIIIGIGFQELESVSGNWKVAGLIPGTPR